MTIPNFKSSLVRILSNENPKEPVGAGFLISKDKVMTCAHVVKVL